MVVMVVVGHFLLACLNFLPAQLSLFHLKIWFLSSAGIILNLDHSRLDLPKSECLPRSALVSE